MNKQQRKYFLSPIENEVKENDFPGNGRKKKSASRERLNLEMSELEKPLISLSTGLFEAVRDGEVDLVKEQLAKRENKKEIDKLDLSGLSLLHQAARYNQTGAAGALLDHGARIDVRTRDDDLTPLHIAAR